MKKRINICESCVCRCVKQLNEFLPLIELISLFDHECPPAPPLRGFITKNAEKFAPSRTHHPVVKYRCNIKDLKKEKDKKQKSGVP